MALANRLALDGHLGSAAQAAPILRSATTRKPAPAPDRGYEGVRRRPFHDIVVRNDVEAVLSGEGTRRSEWGGIGKRTDPSFDGLLGPPGAPGA